MYVVYPCKKERLILCVRFRPRNEKSIEQLDQQASGHIRAKHRDSNKILILLPRPKIQKQTLFRCIVSLCFTQASTMSLPTLKVARNCFDLDRWVSCVAWQIAYAQISSLFAVVDSSWLMLFELFVLQRFKVTFKLSCLGGRLMFLLFLFMCTACSCIAFT